MNNEIKQSLYFAIGIGLILVSVYFVLALIHKFFEIGC